LEYNLINMKIISSAFSNNGPIPPKHTCDGENINPALEISDVPPEAKSLALICDDPDAPGRTFIHWAAWNLKPGTVEILEGQLPAESIEGKTDFGKVGYGGPCPPSGTHRYFFRLFALDTILNLPEAATREDLEKSMAVIFSLKRSLLELTDEGVRSDV